MITTGDTPAPRRNNSLVVYNDSLYVVAGKGVEYYNDVVKLELKTLKWQKLNPTGDIPTKREAQTSIVRNDCMYLFGGYASPGGASKSLYEYNFEKNCWRKVNALGDPPRVYCHSMVLHDDSLYVFGGSNGPYYNDLYEYSFKTNSWTKIEVSGAVPSKRHEHTTVYVEKEAKMYLFGGYDRSGRINQCHSYDFMTRTWRKLAVSGDIPPKRSRHTAVLDNNGNMIIFGGYCGTVYKDLYELNLGIGSTVDKTFGESLENAFESQIFGDVTIDVSGTKFVAHKCIISQSTFLEALILSVKNTDTMTTITVNDISPAVFKILLKYLYTGRLDIGNGDASKLIELVTAAKVYNLDELEKLVILHFDDFITPKNVIDVLQKAHNQQLSTLKAKCFSVILKNKETILQSKFSLSNDLMMELVQILGNVKPVPTEEVERVDTEHALKDYIAGLLESGKFADITLISSDKKRFKAHRVILSTFSDYFRVMLNGNFKVTISLKNNTLRNQSKMKFPLNLLMAQHWGFYCSTFTQNLLIYLPT